MKVRIIIFKMTSIEHSGQITGETIKKLKNLAQVLALTTVASIAAVSNTFALDRRPCFVFTENNEPPRCTKERQQREQRRKEAEASLKKQRLKIRNNVYYILNPEFNQSSRTNQSKTGSWNDNRGNTFTNTGTIESVGNGKAGMIVVD